MLSRKPKLIVFDLDFTLWPLYVDTHVIPPFSKTTTGEVLDGHLRLVKSYKDVPVVLEELHNSGYKMAIASRTSEPELASHLIELFGWDKYFRFREIYPGCKTTHFHNLRVKNGVEFKDMLFFDDESRNIADVRSLGVTCVWVENGVSKAVIKQGLKRFRG